MLPDDDKRYAIETCRSSESVLKKWFKNKWHTISAFVGCVIIRFNDVQSTSWRSGGMDSRPRLPYFDTRRPQQSPLTAERTVGVSSASLTGPAPVRCPLLSSSPLCSNLINKLTNWCALTDVTYKAGGSATKATLSAVQPNAQEQLPYNTAPTASYIEQVHVAFIWHFLSSQ